MTWERIKRGYPTDAPYAMVQGLCLMGFIAKQQEAGVQPQQCPKRADRVMGQVSYGVNKTVPANHDGGISTKEVLVFSQEG